MSGRRAPGSTNLSSNAEVLHAGDAASPAVPAASATGAAAAAKKAPSALSSLPSSPASPSREEVSANAMLPNGATEHGDGLRIRIWYLDDVFTRAEPRFVPDVATLKQLLPDRDMSFATTASPIVAGDHFAEVPYSPPAAAAAAALGDTTSSPSGRRSYPFISLRPSSPTHPGGHPAWVSVKAASQSELTEILNWLPIHVLTRRRVLNILGTQDAAPSDGDALPADRSGYKTNTSSRLNFRGSDGHAAAPPRQRARSSSAAEREEERVREEGESSTDGEEDDNAADAHVRHASARDNFLEYFPAHGYAVLCLQAVPMPKGESTRRGATPREELVTHGMQIPNTPVVALAFESALFTFSLSRFGGEGDVRLIVANHATSPTAQSSRGGMPAGVTAIAALSSVVRLPENNGNAQATAPLEAADDAKEARAMAFEASVNSTLHSPAATARDGRTASSPAPAMNSTPAAAAASDSAQHCTESPTLSSSNWNAATAISVVCSSLISAIIAYLQQSTRSLLMEVDQLDELVLQILPSRVDQDDMLVRTKNIRHFIAAFHIDALQKERVLKQLLLPAMRQTPFAQSTQAIERYQRSLSSVRSTVMKLRKGRDTINMASMTLISGVSARLLTHCNFMDYLNHVQTQIAVVVMPIAVIPGIFATNVKVPWSESKSMAPFYSLLSITLGLMIIVVAYPLYKFYMYRAPKALASLE